MALKKSDGNMYPWVTHTHSHIMGACAHACKYCYVQAMAKKYPNLSLRYSGEPKLDSAELNVDYGKGKTIFVEHMSDILAPNVPIEMVRAVIYHCRRYPENTYVFQTKNLRRYWEVMDDLPENAVLGTTIETNRPMRPVIKNDGSGYTAGISNAPDPFERSAEMAKIRSSTLHPTFVTIEPILDFDLNTLAEMVGIIRPMFVNIGADSKHTEGLDEPTRQQVLDLVDRLKMHYGIEVRDKHNLERLLA